jgi:hypothetical protein
LPQFFTAQDEGIHHPMVLGGELILAELAEAFAGLQRHVARGGRQIAVQYPHQGRLSATVVTDQGPAIAGGPR